MADESGTKMTVKQKESDFIEQDESNTSSQDVELQDTKIPYPKSVFFIVSNEFCERFSFYGMRTVLSLYLRNVLNFAEKDAKIIYHLFIFFVYFFPVFGAIIADSWLGKFKTIFYVSILYAIGNIVLSLGSATPLNIPHMEISLLALMIIALGTGGIKPCVSAFGGDQFVLPQQELQLAKFFSMFYFAINSGSLISTLLTPILRENVHCFGEQSCYPLAFGVPGILMVISIIVFVAGKPLYKIKKPSGNIIVHVSKCIGHAVSRKVKSKSDDKREHWLDYANDKYDDQLINDIKATLKVLLLYIPIPVFWALFDQQGTGWTFQASRMSGDIGFYTILPDQMQVVNPLLILAFIPLFDTVIYPLLNKCRILTTHLQRLTVGGLLAAVAFCISAVIQLQLEDTYPVLPSNGEAQLRIFNGLPCNVHIDGINGTGNTFELNAYAYHYENFAFKSENKTLDYTIRPIACSVATSNIQVQQMLPEKYMSGHFIRVNMSVPEHYEVFQFQDDIEKSGNGYPLVRTMVGGEVREENYKVVYKLEGYEDVVLNTTNTGVEQLTKLPPGNYKLLINNENFGTYDFKLGGVYSVVADFAEKNFKTYTMSEPNSVHILWLIPQYLVITLGEIMFSVTGLEFSYSQAPISMKSVLQAGWLLTTAFGNLLVIIVEEAGSFDRQSSQYFLYAGIMVADMVIFALMAMRYKYIKTPEQNDEEDDISLEATNTSKQGKDNMSFENDNL